MPSIRPDAVHRRVSREMNLMRSVTGLLVRRPGCSRVNQSRELSICAMASMPEESGLAISSYGLFGLCAAAELIHPHPTKTEFNPTRQLLGFLSGEVV